MLSTQFRLFSLASSMAKDPLIQMFQSRGMDKYLLICIVCILTFYTGLLSASTHLDLNSYETVILKEDDHHSRIPAKVYTYWAKKQIWSISPSFSEYCHTSMTTLSTTNYITHLGFFLTFF